MTAELKHTLTLAPVDPDDVYEDEERSDVGYGWRVRTRADIEFALRRKAELEREKAEVAEVAAAEILRIENRRDDINAGLDRGIAFFASRLREYVEANPEEFIQGERKTKKYLYGVLGFRKSRTRLEVKDEAALLAWAKSQADAAKLVRVTEKPAVDAIKEQVEKGGVVVEGAELVGGVDEFYVKGE